MVTESAACALASDRPSVRPVAKAKVYFIKKLQILDLADLGPIRRVPKSCRAFGQRDKSVESHSGEGSQRDLRPNHVDRHATGLGGDAETDALRRCPEKLCNDRANQRQGGIDLQRVENEGQRRRQIKLP